MSGINEALDKLRDKIGQTLSQDKAAFQRRFKKIKNKAGLTTDDKSLVQLVRHVEKSVACLQQKKHNPPVIRFPENLPITRRLDEIEKAIRENQVIILCGETGSGKTTQLPKLCLKMGRGIDGMIGHTQPRRLAARSVSARIAEELETEPGTAVGYKVRFKDQTRDSSYIKLMTDGVLLAEIQQSALLKQYDTLIIDEAHERSLNIDFLLGYLKRLLPKRPDLKVIITSATIDPDKFSKHFNNAPIILVSGRTYPVEVRYRPFEDISLSDAIVDAVDELQQENDGDILVFLSGERDIRDAAEALRKKQYRHTEILPLLARLSAKEQNRIFHPGGLRRIVLATNVAETSLTVPGIRCVIDSGLARISRYSFRSKMQRLPIEKISRAAAEQRKGRCGRVAEGVCIRLYDEDDFNARLEFTDAEIHRTNLASVILQMAYANMGAMEDFPFVDSPDQRMINDGLRLLRELNAFTDEGITATGKEMAAFPLDPQLARMLIEARNENCLAEILVIVSALAIQDPRERPVEKQQAADERHQQFTDKKSDFLLFLKLWQVFQEKRATLTQNKTRQWCSKNFLSYMRMREWQDIHEQLVYQVKHMGIKYRDQFNEEIPYDAIHRALLSGLLSHVGLKTEEGDYLGARGRKFYLFPGSVLFKKKPKWIMAAEIVETQKVYARCNAVIQPQWLEDKARHLFSYQYTEPHWQKRSSQVSAMQSAQLFGLPVYSKRKINFGPVDPVASREIFIWALVRGEYQPRFKFVEHNRGLLNDIQQLEAKSRRLDVLVDEQVLFDFYHARIKPGIYNGPAFEKWWKQQLKHQPELLNMQREQLMQHDAGVVTREQFPDFINFNGVRLKLEYIFDPKLKHDGVCLQVPLMAINSVDKVRCEWLVPGFLKEKVIALIRSLPKNLRKNFVPVPDFADACLQSMAPGEKPLTVALAEQLKRMTGVTISYDDWRTELLEPYLFMTYKLLDNNGRTIKQANQLSDLQQGIDDQLVEVSKPEGLSEFERDEVTDWDFGEIGKPQTINQVGVDISLYPALKKEGKKVALRLFESQQLAEQSMRSGLRQLIRIKLSEQLRGMQKMQKGLQAMCLLYRNIANCQELEQDLLDGSIEDAFILEPLPQTAADFDRLLSKGKGQFADCLAARYQQCTGWLELYQQIQQRLKTMPVSWLEAGADIQDQCQHLLYRHFLVDVPAERLQHYNRYLQAIITRLDKLEADSSKDRVLRLQVQPHWDHYKQQKARLDKEGRQSAELDLFGQMIEEFRVSLFAQNLKTTMPVSDKRLTQQWEKAKLGA